MPNGVAAGDVTATSAILWARTDTRGIVRFEYGTDPTFATCSGTGQVVVVDALAPAKLHVTGLQPGTQYAYRATDPLGAADSGTFRTAQLQGRHGVRIGVSGDWRADLAPFSSVANVPERRLDLWLSLGDTIYAEVPSPGVPVIQARTLTQFRLKHNEVYSRRGGENFLADVRRSSAQFAMIDDHEVTNDFAGGARPANDPRFAGGRTTFINQSPLFRNGLRAFLEYNPMEERAWGDSGDERVDGRADLYRSQRYGDDAAVFLLDARSFRDKALLPPADPNDRDQAVEFLAAAFQPGRSLLGAPQRMRFLEDLRAAQRDGVTWKIVLAPEPLQHLGLADAADRFEGYAWERGEILGMIESEAVRNVVFVSADWHGMLVSELGYSVRASDEETPSGAMEIITGPVAFSPPAGPFFLIREALSGRLAWSELSGYPHLSRDERDWFVFSILDRQLSGGGFSPLSTPIWTRFEVSSISGRYQSLHTYGWTELNVDAESQNLTVTHWGLDAYVELDALLHPEEIAARRPQLIGQFVVHPQAP